MQLLHPVGCASERLVVIRRWRDFYPQPLTPFGRDAKDPAFWSFRLSVIERMIGKLERMGKGSLDAIADRVLL
jgi:hypothetical protein